MVVHISGPYGITSHVHALEFFGAVPEIVVPDNVKTGIKRPCRYEPDLNPTYREMAEYYGLAVVPARPYKARDKAKAEVGVQVAQRWIVAALRHQRFLHVGDLNEASHCQTVGQTQSAAIPQASRSQPRESVRAS